MLSSEIQIGQIVHGCKLCPSWICSLFLAGVTVVTFTVHPPPTLPIYVFQPSSTSVGRPCCSISLDSKHSHQDRHNWPAKIEESGQRHSLAHQLSSGQSQCSPCNWWPVGHSLGPKRLRWVTDDTILPLNSRLKSAITSSPPRVETITGVTIPCFWRQVMWVIRGFSMSRTEEVCEWSESLTDTVAGVFCVAVWLQCGSTRSAGLRSCSFNPAHEHNALAFHNSKPPFFARMLHESTLFEKAKYSNTFGYFEHCSVSSCYWLPLT